MRVLHVIHSIDPRSGGPSQAIRDLVQRQACSGYDVALLATSTQSAEPWDSPDSYSARMSTDTSFAHTRLYLAQAFGRRHPWSRYAYSPSGARWLKGLVRDSARRPEVIHIHGIFSHLTSMAASTARRYGIPYVLRPAGGLDSSCLSMGSKRLKQLFTSLILRNDLRAAMFIHATSTAEAEELAHWVPRNRIRVIPHGVPIPAPGPAGGMEAFLERFPSLGKRRIVLFMSRVAPKKRPELLVEAVARLRIQLPDIALVIAGSDAGAMASVRNAVHAMGMEDISVFTGFLGGELKQSAFAAASVFVLPSVDENFGVAVVEAMAQGVPVVVTPGVASHEYVDQSGGGMTVAGTPDDIAHGIRQILDGDGVTMGRRGKEFVAASLSWASVVPHIGAMYHDAIHQSKIKIRTKP